MDGSFGTISKSELIAASQRDAALSRLQETVIAPALNAGLVEPWNALASCTNSLSRGISGEDLLPRSNGMKVAPVEFLSTGWLAESFSSGLGMLLPYTVAGKLSGSAMRSAGARLNAGGEAAHFLQSGAAAQIIGATIYDGMRETRDGETRFGNALGGAAAFSIFEAGNKLSKGMSLPGMIVARAFSGAVGATTQHTVSGFVARGEIPDKQDLWKAGVGGMVMNMILPESQRALGTVIDRAGMRMGFGVPVDRYVDANLQGKPVSIESPQMASLIAESPWARVQTGASSNDFNASAEKIYLTDTKSGIEKVGRELSRMQQTKTTEIESGFKSAAELVRQGQPEQAWQSYRQLRLVQEAQAHHVESVIASELGQAKTALPAADLAGEIGAWPAPGGVSQEFCWRQEFSEFLRSAGSYRPGNRVDGVSGKNPAAYIPGRVEGSDRHERTTALKSGSQEPGVELKSTNDRDVAVDVVRTLQKDGHIAVFAGGSVRDEIMGRQPKDFDIATSAAPEQVEKVFEQKGYKVLTVGKQFGTVKAIVDGIQVEVTTLRNDGNYTDGRRPDSVEFAGTLREDAARRDLTINAMFKDPTTDTYYDLFGGRADINSGKIRTVGDPAKRFAEDNLRMLRVPRFAARYGFSVEESTLAAIKNNSVNLGKVSSERIREELRGMLASPKPSVGMQIMMDTGLMREVIPEMTAMDGPAGRQDPFWHPEGTAWEHTKLVVDQLAANGNGKNFPLMMSGVLHDIAKPLTQEIKADGRISNPRHEVVGAEMAKDIAARLKMSKNETMLVEKLIAQHMSMHRVQEMRPGKLAELLRKPEISDLIELQNADARGRTNVDAGQDSHREWLLAKSAELKTSENPNQRLDAKPLVDGNLINSMGFPKLPIRREILEAARLAQLEGIFSTPDQGRVWVLQNYGQHLNSH